MVTKDVIRTLCWDSVRSMNRRIRAANPEAAQTRPGPKRHKQPSSQPATTFRVDPDVETSQSHTATKNISKKIISSVPTKGNTTPFTSRVNPISDKVSRPRPVPAGVLRKFIPPVAIKENIPASSILRVDPISGDEISKSRPAPKITPKKRIFPVAANSPPADDEMFKVKIGNRTITFATDISYDEFDNTIQNHLIVEHGEIRVYRANTETRRDREWKPVQFPSELTNLIEKYADVEVELTVQKQVK